jgi:expansin (peptidoglycan-binding protein)
MSQASEVRKSSEPMTVGAIPIYLVSQLAACCTLVTCSADFYHEDGGDTFLQNISSHTNYTALHPITTAMSTSRMVTCSADFYHEDGGDTFLQNISSHTNYTALHPITTAMSTSRIL